MLYLAGLIIGSLLCPHLSELFHMLWLLINVRLGSHTL